mmetsp:Transcript_26357/g.46749  ORF Transcript_26357/g.46749 Transcript_26357/m.46749 type:complete len:223 (+) Transcript_26357:371-1039(+)
MRRSLEIHAELSAESKPLTRIFPVLTSYTRRRPSKLEDAKMGWSINIADTASCASEKICMGKFVGAWMSQTYTFPSSPPQANMDWSLFHAMQLILPFAPLNLLFTTPLRVSHISTWPSAPAEMNVVRSSETKRSTISALCMIGNFLTSEPSWTFQRYIYLSSPADIMYSPEASNLIVYTGPWCAFIVLRTTDGRDRWIIGREAVYCCALALKSFCCFWNSLS